ncbi:MAG: DUF1189 family protein [Candidatus Omnitrophica bacterium]|nr:DUF1189 family protein [Candidatus Omnitrophota bacterium]
MFSELIGSFSFRFYRKIIRQSFKRSIIFFILFICFISAIVSFKGTIVIKSSLPKIVSWIENNLKYLSDLPFIEIKEGKIITPQDTYLKKWDDKFTFIIEPNKEKAGVFLQDYSNVGILTQEQFFLKITKPRGAEIKSYSLTNIKSLKVYPVKEGIRFVTPKNTFLLNSHSVERFLKKISVFIYPIIFLWFLSWYGVSKSLHILIFSIFSFLINNKLSTSLTYKQILSIGIYAIIPVTLLGLIKDLIGLQIPMFWFIYSLVYMGFIYRVIERIKEE